MSSNSVNELPDKLDQELEYFTQEYERDFDKIHKRLLAGEISVSQQINLADKSWNKHAKEFKKVILQTFATALDGVELPKHSSVATGNSFLKKEVADKMVANSETAEMLVLMEAGWNTCIEACQQALNQFREGLGNDRP